MSSTAAPSRRDARKADTKKQISKAALDLVQKVGWRAATIDKIAEAAGVAKGTFFVHFPNKEALVQAVVALQVGAAQKARDAAFGTGPLERMRETVLVLGRQAGNRIELTRAVLIATMQSDDVADAVDELFGAVREQLEVDAREALTRGLLTGIDAEGLASLLLASYLGAALHCTTSRRAKPLDDVLRPLVDATLAAFGTPATAKKTKKKGTP